MDTESYRERRRVGRAVSRFWHEVYLHMKDNEEGQAMRAEDVKLDFREFTRCALLLGWYEPMAAGLLKQGVPLSRAGFIASVGMPIMTPDDLARMVVQGFPAKGFNLMALPTPPLVGGNLNGRR